MSDFVNKDFHSIEISVIFFKTYIRSSKMISFLISVVTVTIAVKIYCKLTCGMCKCEDKMIGRVVIVTGANTGIGYETARDLARRGAKVIVACRDQVKGLQARDKIIQSTGNNKVIFKQLDLSSFASVNAFANDILKTEDNVHVLINNAGTGKLDNSLTEDDLPIEVQVNHFGPFLLTTLLLPLIRSSAPSRIINVSSLLHKVGKVDPDAFHKQVKSSFEHMRLYSNTKLANMLFTLKLSKILEDSKVTVNCLHPGLVNTDIFRNRHQITRFIIGALMKTPYEGAQTSIFLAVAPELEKVSGKYFCDCQISTPSKNALDSDLADKLWELSEKMVYQHKK